MTSDGQAARPNELTEREDGFNYGFRMKCDCGELSDLSAEDYLERESLDARMSCSHCGASIHYGPAAAGIRDEDDPVLDNATVARFAWYHSTTSPDWPSDEYASQVAAQLQNAERRLGFQFGNYIERKTTKALHVGTYEAAVENMLRRMHDQADATSQFYLYRVALDIDNGRINDGYRDENLEPAAQISLSDLKAEGLDAIRYLNAHEAIGSLSLAIHPRVIRSLQVIPLPITDLAAPRSAALSERLAKLEAEHDGLKAAATEWSGIEERRLRSLQLGLTADPSGVGERAKTVERQGWGLWDRVFDELAAHYLEGVSPLVQRDYRDALRDWRRDAGATVSELADFFAVSAATLTHGPAVVQRLSETEPRPYRGDVVED